MAAASGLAEEFQIVLPANVKIKNITSSVYLLMYGIIIVRMQADKSLNHGMSLLKIIPLVSLLGDIGHDRGSGHK